MRRNKWIELYHSALLELAESELRFPELSECVAMAQDAMEARRQELQEDRSHDLERTALEHAMHNLRSAMLDLASKAPSGRA